MDGDASEARASEPFLFQFGLSTMMIWTAVVAVGCSLLFRMPNVAATICLAVVSLGRTAV